MSMPTLEDVKNFFRTLISGEFEYKWRESSAAIIVRGLIGIIPGIGSLPKMIMLIWHLQRLAGFPVLVALLKLH